MTRELTCDRRLPSRGLLFLCVVLLVMGIFFRCANLDQKVYWGDETYTSLRISGYTEKELRQQIYDGHEIGIEDLQKYQRINSEKGLIDTVKGLAIEEPQLTPLYFVMVRFWVQWFGNSIAVTRSLLAILSLLAFPLIYWLCLELFASSLVGWLAIALIAISPMHLLYAQDARPYYLWIVAILLSSAALLWTMQRSTKLSWGLYAATVALGLYTHLLFVLVAIGQGFYVLAIESFRLSKTLIAYLLAFVAGLLAFVPWIWIVVDNFSAAQKATSWTTQRRNLFSLIKAWVGDLSRVFLDLGSTEAQILYIIPLIVILLILSGYSVYFLCSHTPKRVWLFVLTLILTTGLTLILSDLILGAQLSTLGRYLLPCYLGIELAVAYTLAAQIISKSINKWAIKLWQIMMIGLFSMGVFSCVISVQAQEWWNKDPTYHYPQVASIINQASRPLVISDIGQANIIALSYLLDTKVRFQLLTQPSELKFSDKFSDVFLYRPSKGLQDSLEQQQNYKIELVYKPAKLLRIKKA